jgi:hypothetical protein
MKRAKKLRKKRTAMKKTAPALALKGSGMGQDFSIAIASKANDERLRGQASQSAEISVLEFFV